MKTVTTKILKEVEIKEAVALWINCTCSKADETVTKDNVALDILDDGEVIAEVTK